MGEIQSLANEYMIKKKKVKAKLLFMSKWELSAFKRSIRMGNWKGLLVIIQGDT